MLGAAWFLEFLDIWDDEQRQKNTVAYVDELHRMIPQTAMASKDDVAAWVTLEKLKEEQDD